MRTSELLSVAYGVYVAPLALRRHWGFERRKTVWSCAAMMVALPLAIAAVPQSPWTVVLRDWAPGVFILISHYASGALFAGPSTRFEAWLDGWDSRLPLVSKLTGLPSSAAAVFEVLYAGTFLVIPTGFAVLAAAGFSSLSDRYWTMVSLSEYVAFGFLPWLPSRPPWVVERLEPEDSSGVRSFGLSWVRRTSHGANTFPSGHTAGSLTVAFAVMPFVPLAGVVLLAIAIGIAIGCVAGRYHYAIDVVAGVAVALAVLALMGAVSR